MSSGKVRSPDAHERPSNAQRRRARTVDSLGVLTAGRTDEEAHGMATAPDRLTETRAMLRERALDAVGQWRDATLAALCALATQATVLGPDRLIVLRATANDLDEPVDGIDDEVREELTAVDFAGPGRRLVTWTPATVPAAQWVSVASLWDELREALGCAYGMFVPVALVIDVDRLVVSAYEAFYCPDEGPAYPDVTLDCAEPVGEHGDPFERLLASLEPLANPQDRIEALMTQYSLDAPSQMAHPEGQCSTDVD
jgi:hypothetical protein